VATPLPLPEMEQRLRARLGDGVLGFEDRFGHAVVRIAVEHYRDTAGFLRDDPDFAMDFLDLTCAVDYGEDGMEIVTHLYSTQHHHQVRILVRCPAQDLHCPTLSDIYPGANWHERETTEMFGVTFDGHPLPVKLLLAEGFEGHPLRKDFSLMSREVKPWPGATEGEDEEE
jgi:NADH-quinone oxidoreductase subunit C